MKIDLINSTGFTRITNRLTFLFLILVFIMSFQLPVFAQDTMVTVIDTVPISADTVISEIAAVEKHSPARAALFSAVVPGLGQAYNRKYWKIPIIYAGLGALTYSIIWNSGKHKLYSNAYRIRIDGDSTTIDDFEEDFSESQLQVLKNYYKRNLDLSILGAAILYALNIIDATVDAHLFQFDVSDDLSLRVQPVIHSYEQNHYYHGIVLNLQRR